MKTWHDIDKAIGKGTINSATLEELKECERILIAAPPSLQNPAFQIRYTQIHSVIQRLINEKKENQNGLIARIALAVGILALFVGFLAWLYPMNG